MEKGQKFNWLEICRYGVTPFHNDGPQVTRFNSYTIHTASPTTWELVMQITYRELCDALKKHFNPEEVEDAGRTQSYRNHISSLNSYLASVGKTLDSRVGVELGSGFDDSLKHYLEIIQVAPRTKRDRRNHLRLIRRLHGELAACSRKPDQAPTSLSIELRTAIAKSGLEPKTLAKRVGASTSALQRWLKGAMPNKRGIPSLHRLESALGFSRGHLVSLLKENVTSAGLIPAKIDYRDKLRELTKDRYILPESELTPEFAAEWRALLDYKTCICPILERQDRAKWRCIPKGTSKRMSPLVQLGNSVCPSGNIALQRIRGFFGVILMSPNNSGMLPEAETNLPQTLAWLAYPGALNTYLNWMTQRSGGVMHQGQKVFCRFVAALLRPSTGYLWQSSKLAERLPESCRPRTPDEWRLLCEQGHKVTAAWIRESTGVSRDPALPISGLLELEQPLKPIMDAIDLIEQAAAEASSGSLTEALLRRDSLLVAMLLSNPLRVRTMMSITWSANGTGTLHGNAKSGWRLRLQDFHSKNGKGVYDVRIATFVKSRLEAYLEEYRGVILGNGESQYLFVSSRSNGMWEGMESHVPELMRRYVKGSLGFGAHAFRYLVATDWLTRYPNDYLTVAELLNDKIETVIKHYAHLKKDTSFQRYEEHLNSMMIKKRP